MKKNNKGFMLAEAIISGTIIITSMILLYQTFNRIYVKYQEKNNYYSIDAVYATKEMIANLMDNNFSKTINNITSKSNHYILVADGICQSSNIDHEGNTISISGLEKFCNNDENSKSINKIYNINNMIITEYDKTVLEELKNKLSNNTELTINQTFKEYIDFVIGYYGVSNHDTQYTYIVLTEIKDDKNNYYYANLGIG